jgi:hypothetical protein
MGQLMMTGRTLRITRRSAIQKDRFCALMVVVLLAGEL